MDQGTAPTKLGDGLFVVDRNGRHDEIGSWGQRLGVVRMGGGATRVASGTVVLAVHQFIPLGSGSQTWASVPELSTPRVSALIAIAGGVAEGFHNPLAQVGGG